jgi:hypothetical protein
MKKPATDPSDEAQDARESALRQRESAQDERERLADARDRVAAEGTTAGLEVTLDERARALGESIPDVVRRQQEAIDRSRDVLHQAEQRLV